MQAYVERLQVELVAKDKDIKRLEDNLGYLRLEHSKLREVVAVLEAASNGISKVITYFSYHITRK